MPIRSPALERRYTFEYELGQWTFGTTQVLRERQSDALKTCKVVPKARVKGRADVLPRLQKLRELSHPYICSVTDVLDDPNYYYIISDACNGGDLGDWMDRLDKSQFWLVEQTIAMYAAQMAAALAYCHSQQVYHRDLRFSSIQLSSKMPDATVLIGDFGLAEILDPDYTFARLNPSPFTAPEQRSHTGRVHGAAPDVWSFGAILHALLVGQPPSDEGFDLSPSRLLSGAPNKDAWAGRSPASHELVQTLLRSAGERPSAARILNHRWLKSVVLRSFPLGDVNDDNKEVRKRLLCYMTTVLLVPTEVSCEELLTLRAAFRQADHDYDNLVQRSVALEVLYHTLGAQDPEASDKRVGKAEIEQALQVMDVRATRVLDFCTFICTAALVRLGGTAAARQTSEPRSPSARRVALAEELAQRALDRFFEVHGDSHSRSVVPITLLFDRLHTQTGQEMELSAGVNYEEVLAIFRDIDNVDRHLLATELLGSTGRGTPLSWGFEAIAHEVDIESCWEPPLSINRIDRFFRNALMSCGLGTENRSRPHWGKLMDLDCSSPPQCFSSTQE